MSTLTLAGQSAGFSSDAIIALDSNIQTGAGVLVMVTSAHDPVPTVVGVNGIELDDTVTPLTELVQGVPGTMAFALYHLWNVDEMDEIQIQLSAGALYRAAVWQTDSDMAFSGIALADNSGVFTDQETVTITDTVNANTHALGAIYYNSAYVATPAGQFSSAASFDGAASSYEWALWNSPDVGPGELDFVLTNEDATVDGQYVVAFVESSSGGGNTSGTLQAQNATTSGSAARVIPASGTVQADNSTASGNVVRFAKASGTPQAQDASINVIISGLTPEGGSNSSVRSVMIKPIITSKLISNA